MYVTDLCVKAKSCEFGDLFDSLIRNRIVCSITDHLVRARLLRDENLTQDKAVQT
ncbi:hypothetical protein HOLleu_39692 [Holothuria leucospilota]|uniref:Uncharacterized protein n=1 Tax=Holothuria leucospilota TaxID=206669 RepID=A0A9Q0YES6_HOLLE|nr:hypothetical protein HOLleu_39692 [Holothuria leucospilota]